ncbi:hypothetical protein SCI_1472 [Streptococcus constellatus subsp. pharyngis C1050]|nr:hypothetical protein SCRE_1429 [Streptococcus constellatus subsp. pharyngis C232]AGU75002.1 hypothetical protein SCR2_1429 [Streptococcus constellatus subsp. pharyngis C818]AGU80393.1 hypothetical protein SCI_1472 [Streptococcus constellatus subsp. pharyngis C1050]AGU82051.1 hypothetical protein SAIN_1318 [Streptococcus anginosus C1051]
MLDGNQLVNNSQTSYFHYSSILKHCKNKVLKDRILYLSISFCVKFTKNGSFAGISSFICGKIVTYK